MAIGFRLGLRERHFGLLVAGLACAFGGQIGLARADDGDPKALTCSFTSGESRTYEDGRFQTKPSSPLGFTIEAIDVDGQTAALKASPDAKPGKLSVVRAINAIHFLEVVNEGFLNITTVYDKEPATGKYPAVHSRHGAVIGAPVFGQYTGFCADE